MPGSFNPLHCGHRCLKQVAERMLQQEVVFELSLQNADKGDAGHDAVAERLAQFTEDRIVVTRTPRFVDKRRLFPNCCFVVGYDTAVRILDARFYDNCVDTMYSGLEQLRANGNRFLVAGRTHRSCDDEEMTFRSLEHLAIPPSFCNLFVDIPESVFRVDVSSTQLRKRVQQPSRRTQ